MQKKAYNSEMVRDAAKDTSASKTSSNFWSEEYRQSFRIKWRGVSNSATLQWASCLKVVGFKSVSTDMDTIDKL